MTMTSEKDPRIKILRDDDLDPINVEMFNAFIEGFMQGVVSMLDHDRLDEYMIYVEAQDREWKSYEIKLRHGNAVIARFSYDPSQAWDKLVGQFLAAGYNKEDAEDLVVFTMGIGPDRIRDRVQRKVAVASAAQAAPELGIDPVDPEEVIKNRGFKPDKGEA